MRIRAIRRGACLAIGGLFLLWIAVSGLAAQAVTTGTVTFPKDATALDGLPQIRIDTTRDSATRRAQRADAEHVVRPVIGDRPSCHTRCERTNLWQAIALCAARQHVMVHFVEPGHGLEKHAGVVALLAREAPWMAPPEQVLTASLPEPRA